jgi:hypothetical protein
MNDEAFHGVETGTQEVSAFSDMLAATLDNELQSFSRLAAPAPVPKTRLLTTTPICVATSY